MKKSCRVRSCKVTGSFLPRKSQSFVPVKSREAFYGKSFRVFVCENLQCLLPRKALEFIPVKLQGTSHEESLRVCSCKVTGNFSL